jgi:hypothetical protein
MAGEVERIKPTDPREQAYQAGMELARRMGVGGSSGEVAVPEGDAFAHPFFQQGQNKRVQSTKKTVHVISDTEYILTEETTFIETNSFGNDIFK